MPAFGFGPVVFMLGTEGIHGFDDRFPWLPRHAVFDFTKAPGRALEIPVFSEIRTRRLSTMPQTQISSGT